MDVIDTKNGSRQAVSAVGVCRSCGRRSRMDECNRCFLDRIESELEKAEAEAELRVAAARGETAAPARPAPVAAPAADPAPPKPAAPPVQVFAYAPRPAADESATDGNGALPPGSGWTPNPCKPPERHKQLGMRGPQVVTALVIGFVLVIAYLLISDDGPQEPGIELRPTAVAPGPGEAPYGDWQGRIAVEYENGVRDELSQSLNIARLEEGEIAGRSASSQNGARCEGTLRYLGSSGATYSFAYREQNTGECIAKGEIELTVVGGETLRYREVTDVTTSRGQLAPN